MRQSRSILILAETTASSKYRETLVREREREIERERERERVRKRERERERKREREKGREMLPKLKECADSFTRTLLIQTCTCVCVCLCQCVCVCLCQCVGVCISSPPARKNIAKKFSAVLEVSHTL